MSYHGKLQTLKNGTADAEIQQWAHNELAVAEINYENAERIIQEQKAELNHMRSFFGCDPAYYGMKSAEPVAWMRPDTLECGYGGNVDWEDTGCIPLYHYPANTPTDEEMKNIAIKHQGIWDEDTFLCVDYRSFARAILRKAQEK
jgi:hypothetical protein